MFVEKYRPNKLSEYIGQKNSVQEFLEWIKGWKPGKAIIFHGRPGVGKTSLVYAFASENGLDLVQTNASDLRSSTELRDVISGAVSQKSLSNRGKIFLFDEIDGLSGYEDKGGVGEMIKIIKESRYPVIMIANDPYNKRLIELRKNADMINFRKLTVWDVIKRLQRIADDEKVSVNREHIHMIAKKSDGDLRSAINDLEVICRSIKPTLEEVQQLGLREREVSIFDALKSLFKASSAMSAKFSIGSVEKDPEEIFWWIENNITNEYEDPEEIADAFEMLSRADVFRQRIRSRQNWKFLSYMIDLMTGGVAVSKKIPYSKFTRYEYPRNIMILGRTKGERAASKELFSAMAKELHCSQRKLKWEFLPFLKIMMKNESLKENLAESLGVEKESLEILS